MRTGLWACVVAALALAALSCGKSKEKEVERAVEKETGGKAKADIEKDKITIKGKEGEMTITAGGGAEIPEGFPRDVPIYKGAAVAVSSRQGKTFTLLLQTDDDPKKVLSACKADLKAQGWAEGNVLSMPQGTIMQYTKGDRSVNLTVATSDEKTQIQLVAEGAE